MGGEGGGVAIIVVIFDICPLRVLNLACVRPSLIFDCSFAFDYYDI
jgi:hypothetical protein